MLTRVLHKTWCALMPVMVATMVPGMVMVVCSDARSGHGWWLCYGTMLGDRDGWPMAPIVVVVVVLGAVVIGGDARAVVIVLTITPRMTMVVVVYTRSSRGGFRDWAENAYGYKPGQIRCSRAAISVRAVGEVFGLEHPHTVRCHNSLIGIQRRKR